VHLKQNLIGLAVGLLVVAVVLALPVMGGCAAGVHASGARSRPPVAAAQVRPIVIGHRGASGYRPEHTLAAYDLAIAQGADFVEPDLVMTRDGQLMARHENEIGGTTDVASRPEFAGRKVTRLVDGVPVTGWFTEDFTLAELKMLRAVERIPKVRPASTRFDGRFEIATLREIIELVRRREAETGRAIGIYPEIKHGSYFAKIGLPMERALVNVLHASGYKSQPERVFIQSFEVGTLRTLRVLTALPLTQLIEPGSSPYDLRSAGSTVTFNDMATPAGLAEIAMYADAVGAGKFFVIPRDPSGNLMNPTTFVADAHRAGLRVHVWTMRTEEQFLPANLKGDAKAEFAAYLAAGVDGVFTDQPDVGRGAVDEFAGISR